jgi:heme/copper-type cytochrome/quinol oxidase subunit 2
MLFNPRMLHHAQRAIPLMVLIVLSLLAIPSAEVAAEAKREEADRVISIVAERFSFVPSVIRLEQGEVVELRIRSLDTNHGFRIRDAGVNVIVPKRGRGDARILFRAQKKGVFPFDCSKACGAGHTIMRGRIVVK